MLYRLKKYFKIGPYGLSALVIVIMAAALRILLIAQGWPSTNSDEGTMGLMAMHIVYRGEHPIFLYGQNYMGAIEAYIAAPLFSHFGPSLFSLRLGLVFLYVLFLVSMYVLTCLLFSRKLAVVTLLLLSLGSSEMFTRQLKALGGDVETMLFGASILLVAAWLAITFDAAGGARTSNRTRLAAYALLGILIGLGLWSHMLVLPFIAMGMTLPLLFCRQELRTKRVIFLLCFGFIIGGFPLLFFNIQNPGQNSIVTLLHLHSSGGTPEAAKYGYSPGLAVLGTLLVSLPTAIGATPLCPTSAAVGQWVQTIPCMSYQGIWGLGYVLLLALAIWLVQRELRAWRRRYASSHLFEDRSNLARSTARLALLGAAALTLIAYVLSPAPALVPITSTRYLVGLVIATPALLAPLIFSWHGNWRGSQPLTAQRRALRFARYAVLLFIGTIYLVGTIGVFQEAPAVQSTNSQQDRLIGDLLHIGAAHIYSDYWTCDRIIFQSNERIICSVLSDSLTPGQNRYLPYRKIVEQDPRAAYALVIGSAQDAAFIQQMAGETNHYALFTYEGYHIYQPVSATGMKRKDL